MANWRDSKIQKFAPLAATLLLFVFEGTTLKLPSDRQIETRTTLAIITSSLGSWCENLAMVTWIACLIFSIMSLFTRNKWGLLSILAFLICPIIGIATGFEPAITHYENQGTIKDVDGSEYQAFTNSFLHGNKIILTKVISRTKLRTDYKILTVGSFSGDANRIRLIRPMAKPNTSTLIITKGRQLICSLGTTDTFAAFDLTHQASVGISKVSPFALISPTDTPNRIDFEEARKDDAFNVSDPKVLKTELSNPNSKVREMAREWLNFLATKPSTEH